MGHLTIELFRDLNPEDFRVLTAVEMGMRNHELVSGALCVLIAQLEKGGCHKILDALCQRRLVAYEVKQKLVAGYRLTNSGYDFLALKALTNRNSVTQFGNKIGVGKESDVYVVQNEEGLELCLKLHRLGRTSFRQLKNKRDYHKGRAAANWLYLSRLSATKEFSFMKALHEHKFSVPEPLECNRHAVLMSLVHGTPLCKVRCVREPGKLYEQCMQEIVRLASHGLIHGDFNEFNIIITHDGASKRLDAQVHNGDEEDDNDDDLEDDDENCKLVMIDFPQMVSTSHPNAKYYFDRDVECIRNFFLKRFRFEASTVPQLHELAKIEDLDVKLKASGYQFKDKQDDNESEVDEKRNDVFTDCMDEEWRDVGDVVESEGVGDVVKSEDENTKLNDRKIFTEAEIKKMHEKNVKKLKNIQLKKKVQKDAKRALKHKLKKHHPHTASLLPVWDY